MTPYRDWDNDSGVKAYDVGPKHIDVAFKGGAVYRYTEQSVGTRNLSQMVELAKAGEGLNSFIQRVVRKRYSEKLK